MKATTRSLLGITIWVLMGLFQQEVLQMQHDGYIMLYGFVAGLLASIPIWIDR